MGPFNLRGREISRIEGFSDAIFGFAATLLVVSLEVPRSIDNLLLSIRGFAAFGLSFGALVAIWMVHNAFFRRFGMRDTTTALLNALLLFVVLLYVYPLKFLASSFIHFLTGGVLSPEAGYLPLGDLATLFVVYGCGFIAVFATLSLLYRHAARSRRELALSDIELHDAKTWAAHFMIYVIVGSASVLSTLWPEGVKVGLPGLVYASLGPLCYLHGRKRHRSRLTLEAAQHGVPHEGDVISADA